MENKKHEVDAEFIREAYDASCDPWKKKLEKKFPEVFERVLELGKWYKVEEWLFRYLETRDRDYFGYGFDTETNEWFDETKIISASKKAFSATKEEVESALIAEAERRGLTEGVKYISPNGRFERYVNFPLNLNNEMDTLRCSNGEYIFYKTWATPIKETKVTQSELEAFYKEAKGIDNLKVIN